MQGPQQFRKYVSSTLFSQIQQDSKKKKGNGARKRDYLSDYLSTKEEISDYLSTPFNKHRGRRTELRFHEYPMAFLAHHHFLIKVVVYKN